MLCCDQITFVVCDNEFVVVDGQHVIESFKIKDINSWESVDGGTTGRHSFRLLPRASMQQRHGRHTYSDPIEFKCTSAKEAQDICEAMLASAQKLVKEKARKRKERAERYAGVTSQDVHEFPAQLEPDGDSVVLRVTAVAVFILSSQRPQVLLDSLRLTEIESWDELDENITLTHQVRPGGVPRDAFMRKTRREVVLSTPKARDIGACMLAFAVCIRNVLALAAFEYSPCLSLARLTRPLLWSRSCSSARRRRRSGCSRTRPGNCSSPTATPSSRARIGALSSSRHSTRRQAPRRCAPQFPSLQSLAQRAACATAPKHSSGLTGWMCWHLQTVSVAICALGLSVIEEPRDSSVPPLLSCLLQDLEEWECTAGGVLLKIAPDYSASHPSYACAILSRRRVLMSYVDGLQPARHVHGASHSRWILARSSGWRPACGPLRSSARRSVRRSTTPPRWPTA